MKNYEKLAINQVVYELAARKLCTSKEAEGLDDFDDYCYWLACLTNSHGESTCIDSAHLTNSHGGSTRIDYAHALYALNMWSHEIKEVKFKLQAQLVIYQYIKYTINIFAGPK